jgi:hypothetical protein
MRVRIVVAGGGAEERAIESEADVVTIGSEADVVLDHAAVAKHAITLRRQTSGEYLAEPGGGVVSRNGARFAERAALATGDHFRAGPFRVTVELRPEAAAPPVPASNLPAAKRDAILTEARARIAWGEDPTLVRRGLETHGMTPAEAEGAVAEFVGVERQETRARGKLQLRGGALLAFAGLCVSLYYGYFIGIGGLADALGFPTCPRTRAWIGEIVVGPILFFAGLVGVVRGAQRVYFADPERFEIGSE